MSNIPKDVEDRNPYANHPQLSSLEGEVLWEYAKLARTIKRVDTLAKETALNPNEALLTDLRALEKKMGLVLTLFKASVWALITDQTAEQEQKDIEERERLQREGLFQSESEGRRGVGGGYAGEGEGDDTVRGY